VIGDQQGKTANGVDAFQTSYLWGFKTSLGERIERLWTGEKAHGDNVTITVDSTLQTRIALAFANSPDTAGKAGAAVVMNYRTGEVLALLSLPTFDPESDLSLLEDDAGHPFWNRALQSVQAPGSTFKIITTASLLQHAADAADHEFDCSTGATMIMNEIIPDYGSDRHGMIKLDKAFRYSCNNAFAQAAILLGDQNLRQTAEDFGFNDNFLFRDLVVENSMYPTEDRNQLELAWSGVGQSKVAATPMHMCMVAAAIANGGVMMEPRMLLRVTSPAGLQRLGFTSKEYTTACTPEIAEQIGTYMKDVVARGTGKAAAVEGLTIAGKTGSAESSMENAKVTHAWFVGYIDEPEYPYAVCVFVENGDTGGKTAAPIAKQIFTWLTE
jgi:peptidoglycan glycosyltransferase